MIRAFIAILLLVCLAQTAGAETVYRQKEKDGSVSFSDRPQSREAKAVKLAPVSSYKPPTRNTNTQLPPPPTAASSGYDSIDIVSPKSEETFRDQYGVIPVVVGLSPSLREGHNVQLLLDGKSIGEPQRVTSFTLSGVERGAHQIEVHIVDSQGKVIATAAPVTFFLHRPRTNMVPRANNPAN